MQDFIRKQHVKMSSFTLILLFLTGCGSSSVKNNERPMTQEILQSDSVQEITQVSAEQFKDFMDAGEGAVLDVRTPGEVAAGRIVEAPINIDFYDDTFADEIAKLDRSETYLLHCKAGSRSSQALTLMQDLGFERVYELRGGIAAWEGAGYAVVK